MTISDGCRQIFCGNHTASFAPDELSTFALHATSVSAFDYAHVDCQPSAMVSDIGQPYAPVVSPPPSFLSRLDSLIGHHCNEWIEIGNWTDPTGSLPGSRGGISPPRFRPWRIDSIRFLPGFRGDISPARSKPWPIKPIGAPEGPSRLRRDPATAHNTPRAPASTTMPS